MTQNNHPEWQEESIHLQDTLFEVQKSLEETEARESALSEEVKRARRQYKSDNSQAYIDLMIQSTIYESLKLKLRNLKTASDKPYFARIDFEESGRSMVEKLYIGKMSLIRDEDKALIIIDWRAPIANLYYEGRLGESKYFSHKEEIHGQLFLKRQYSIEKGKLHGVFDIDITTNDAFLQQYLGANAENRLKDIVSTIQLEQNRIIRAPLNIPLIIQGVAGSGKTTIALHRIAYLIYNYQHQFKPENFMIIAPNRLFLNYISEVLPELGVERVKQTTFLDWAMELIGEPLRVNDPYQKLVRFVNHNATADEQEVNRKLRRVAEFKSSLAFKHILDKYAQWIEGQLLPGEDLAIPGWTVYRLEEIRQLFFRDYQHWPFYQRLAQLKKHFSKRLKEQRPAFIHKLSLDSELKIAGIKREFPESETRRKLILDVIAAKEAKIAAVDDFIKQGVKNYLKKVPKISPVQYYRNLFADPELAEMFFGHLEQELREFLLVTTLAGFRKKSIDYEDLAPIIFLKHCTDGWGEKLQVKHIVIDEAQDFSAFQFYTLRQIIKDSSFTILGDISQGIYDYRGVTNWTQLQQDVFAGTASQLLTLEQSYRTTAEIMTAANQVLIRSGLPNLPLAKPVIRHGSPVELFGLTDRSELIAALVGRLAGLQGEGFVSIAVITKTAMEAEDLQGQLQMAGLSVTLINGTDEEYHGGLVVLPSYLAKGLEFDVALIANASRENYDSNSLDSKLLYVAMTRPLHRLFIYYHGEITPLLT